MKLARFRARAGKNFSLDDHDPRRLDGFDSKDEAQQELKKDVERLAALHDVFYASGQYALLIIFQAMDAAGKDGAIKHVMSGINPQGCQVTSFKTPSPRELAHDYLWRCNIFLPERGRIGIFNRSYYEEVLIVRVHPELLELRNFADLPRLPKLWKRRYREINDFERYLTDNGTLILKFFLNVSKEEQKRRFLERINTPSKNWKYSANDVKERAHWDSYMEAYEEMIAATSTSHAPWYVVPADHKWFSRALISKVLVKTLQSLNLKYPSLEAEELRALEEARKVLEAEV